MVALDQGDDFDISSGFKSTWRAHAWEGIDSGFKHILVIKL